MFNKKMINAVLIIVVVSLWGTVSYKYINRFFGENEVFYDTPENYNFDTLSVISKDTFKLQPLTKDPFLNKIVTQPKIQSSSIPKQSIIKKEPVLKTPIQFPAVQYYGYIKSKDKKEELILVRINNRLERVRLNDNIDGLIINKIYKDSIVVNFNKETRSFKKK